MNQENTEVSHPELPEEVCDADGCEVVHPLHFLIANLVLGFRFRPYTLNLYPEQKSSY